MGTIVMPSSSHKTPQDIEACRLVQEGLALAKSSRHDAAADLFRKAANVATSAEAKRFAGHNAAVALTIIAVNKASQYGSGRPPKSVEAEVEALFEEALHHAPDCIAALDQYGYLKTLQGKMKEATELYSRAADLQPKDYEAQKNCAFSYATCHLYEKALDYANRAFSINNRDAELVELISQLLYQTGEYLRSIDYAKLAIQIDPDQPMAQESAGLGYGMLGELTESAKHFKVAHELNPKDERLTTLYYASWMETVGETRNFRVTREWLDAREWLFQHHMRSNDIEDQRLAKQNSEKFASIFSKFECQRCGRCCLETKWAYSIDAHIMWEDIQRWRSEGRNDILKLIHVYEGLGGDIMNASRGRLLAACPFFGGSVSGQAGCAIHETKPFNCAIAPLYFNPDGVCPYCNEVIPKEADGCPNCGQLIRIDPGFVTLGCPGLVRMKKSAAKELRRMHLSILTP
jgi:tetratricopeptide (TPR) repeat protein